MFVIICVRTCFLLFPLTVIFSRPRTCRVSPHHRRQSVVVTRSRTVTNDTPSQSNTYHHTGNTQTWKWLTWNGNVSHSVGPGSWSEILAVGETEDDKRLPVWARMVEVLVLLHFFLRRGRERSFFPLDKGSHSLFPLFYIRYNFFNTLAVSHTMTFTFELVQKNSYFSKSNTLK